MIGRGAWRTTDNVVFSLLWCACAATSLGLQLSPWQAVKPLLDNQGNVDDASGVPYISMACCSTLWLTFGIIWSDAEVVVTSLAGAFLGWTYTAIYVRKCDKHADYWKAAVGGAIIFFWLLWCYCVVAPEYYATVHIGVLALLFQVMLYSSPLCCLLSFGNDRKHWRHLIVRMPRLQSIWTTICAATWFVYGLTVFDWFIIIPNAIGVVLGVLQLVLIRKYSSAKVAEPVSFVRLRSNSTESSYSNVTGYDGLTCEDFTLDMDVNDLSVDLKNARL